MNPLGFLLLALTIEFRGRSHLSSAVAQHVSGCLDGDSFELYLELESYPSAQIACQEQGGDLARISSQEDYDFLQTLKERSFVYTDLWIGKWCLLFSVFSYCGKMLISSLFQGWILSKLSLKEVLKRSPMLMAQ